MKRRNVYKIKVKRCIMKISTKGRYALRMMTDLASQEPGVYTPLKDIAVRQDISQKYLESIMTSLSKSGLVDSLHGKGAPPAAARRCGALLISRSGSPYST